MKTIRAILFPFALIALAVLFLEWRRCDAAHGTLVRTLFWVACFR